MPETTRVLIEVNSVFGRIHAFKGDVITKQLVKFGAHTRPELAFLLNLVRAGDFVFDLGGHIGTFAIPLARRIGPRGRIVVVEGSALNFDVLQKNMESAELEAELSLVHALVAPYSSKYTEHRPDGNSGASYFLPVANTEGTSNIIESLDQLCERHFVPRVVKMDLEGYEVIALECSPKLLSHRPIIYAEISSLSFQRVGSSVSGINELFVSHGYRLFKNIGDRNAAHDNFVVKELHALSEGGEFFDVLAVHCDDSRLKDISHDAR